MLFEGAGLAVLLTLVSTTGRSKHASSGHTDRNASQLLRVCLLHTDKLWTERFQLRHIVFVKKNQEGRLNAARHDNTQLMSQSCLTCFVSREPLSVRGYTV